MREGASVPQGRVMRHAVTAPVPLGQVREIGSACPVATTDGAVSGVEVQLALVHLAALQLYRHVLNPEETHRIMNVL